MVDRSKRDGSSPPLVALLLPVLLASAPGLARAGDAPARPRPADPPPGAVDPEVARELDLAANVESLRGEPFERVLMTLEHRQDWRRIAWRKDIAAAMEDSRASGKPIAVVMMLPEYGQTSSPFS
jgi:hypothetical protein